jgi:hypothetical protein
MTTPENIIKNIEYYESLRNTVVNSPIEMGYVATQAIIKLVVDKLNELHKEYKRLTNEDYPWNTVTIFL